VQVEQLDGETSPARRACIMAVAVENPSMEIAA